MRPVSCLKNTASKYYLPPKAKKEKQCKYRFMFLMVRSVGNVSFLCISLSFFFLTRRQNLSVFLRLTSFTALLTFRVRRRIFIKDVWKLLLSQAKVWCSVKTLCCSQHSSQFFFFWSWTLYSNANNTLASYLLIKCNSNSLFHPNFP